MDTKIFEAKGINGQVELFDNRIQIKREGFLAKLSKGGHGEREVFLKNLSSVILKKNDALSRGHIRFSFAGAEEAPKGILNAGQDDNTVLFSKKQEPDFIKFQQMVQEKISNIQNGSNKASNNSNGLDQLEKLNDLKQKGIITEDEFNQKKKVILGL